MKQVVVIILLLWRFLRRTEVTSSRMCHGSERCTRGGPEENVKQEIEYTKSERAQYMSYIWNKYDEDNSDYLDGTELKRMIDNSIFAIGAVKDITREDINVI